MLCVLWLGSSVGNLKPEEAVGFFKSVQESAGPNVQVSTPTTTFLGTDAVASLTFCCISSALYFCVCHMLFHIDFHKLQHKCLFAMA